MLLWLIVSSFVMTSKAEESPIIETEFEESAPSLLYLGTFKTTGYCNCRKCNGKWAYGPTASGVMPQGKHTIAVDKNVIPLGSHVLIDGIEYVAEDTGGKWVIGKHIDIFYSDHVDAEAHEVQYKEVYLVE